MSRRGDQDDEKGFASRWSRLKRDARNPAPGLEKGPEATLPAEAEAASEERTDEEILEALGLPDPDGLKPGDDFSAFMAKTVPARLRSRALRKLWISNPVLANLDELVDYGEDFTDAATVIENLATGYQVGKGWAEKLIETPKPFTATEEEEADEAAGPEVEAEGGTEGSAKPDPAPEDASPEAVEDQAGFEDKILAEAPVAPQQFPPKRRMRFRVAED